MAATDSTPAPTVALMVRPVSLIVSVAAGEGADTVLVTTAVVGATAVCDTVVAAAVAVAWAMGDASAVHPARISAARTRGKQRIKSLRFMVVSPSYELGCLNCVLRKAVSPKGTNHVILTSFVGN